MVLAIIAVLLCIAIPSFSRMLARHRVVTAQLELIASLQHARSLAITSGRRILFCPLASDATCANDTHWEHGWAIGRYLSTNADQLDGPPSWVHNGYRQLIITSTGGRKRVRFQPDGTTGGSNVSFTLCGQGHTEDALTITVSIVGRVASAKASDDQAYRCATDS
ncbi:hypothetical protein DyAD56_03200 [Dyella sp. AD56]|nr:hypothetical protein DyAD56_03200 [Dyella sp. AD56]ULU25015.1 GspH/FimT family pseudopilin [Dyella terrae]